MSEFYNTPKLEVQRPPTIDFAKINRSIRETKMADHGYASVLYERLIEQIRDFEADLNPDEEIAAYLSSFGTTFLIQIENVGYHNPFFIIFHGRSVNDGNKVKLVQHTSQINVLFTSVKLQPEENRKATRIGFNTGFGDEEEQV